MNFEITQMQAMNDHESLGLQQGGLIAPEGPGSVPYKPLMRKVNANECEPCKGIAPKNFNCGIEFGELTGLIRPSSPVQLRIPLPFTAAAMAIQRLAPGWKKAFLRALHANLLIALAIPRRDF